MQAQAPWMEAATADQEAAQRLRADRLRTRKRRAWIAFFLLLPITLLGQLISGEAGAIVAFYSWATVFAVANLVSWWTKCPRCGKQFHLSDKGFSNPWTGRCLHCGFAV